MLNNYLDVELRWKNISLFVWSEEALKFEEVLLDMLADQVGLTSIKCFMGVSLKRLMHHVSSCSWFKGIAHSKLKCHLFTTHPYVGGGSGAIF